MGCETGVWRGAGRRFGIRSEEVFAKERGGTMYKRVLIKMSGEALGENGILFDFTKINRVAAAIGRLSRGGTEVALVLGGGNIWRGRAAAPDMDDVTADHMGMLGTAINALAMQDALCRAGLEARVMSAVEMTAFAEPYFFRAAREHLSSGRVVLFCCGTGDPFHSTDTAADQRAAEMGAGILLLAKNVDGVYDGDPKRDKEAKLLRDLTFDEALQLKSSGIDTAALIICKNRGIPIHVFGLETPEDILRAAAGETFGTLVHG